MTTQPCSDLEMLVADAVEGLWQDQGLHPGKRECHNAQRGRFATDFYFREAQPVPIALEITRITDGEHLAGIATSERLDDELTAVAEAEELGCWLVTVSTGGRLRALRADILNVIRDLRPRRERMLMEGGFIRPGWYAVDDLDAFSSDSSRTRFMDEHQRLKDAGLVEIQPIRANRSNGVFLLPMTDVRIVGGFPNEIRDCVEDNREKLLAVPEAWRSLAVLVDRFDLSPDETETSVPDLGGLDELLVLFWHRHGGELRRAWHAFADSVDWETAYWEPGPQE